MGYKKPNFFIIGAPKCGTTSLSRWLAQHPQVYISKQKEPKYFDTDLTPATTSEAKYQSNFKGVKAEHRAIGEASVSYLHSRCAVPNALEYSPDARFVVCLRSPIEMALSLHGDNLYFVEENVSDFEKAWRMQEVRKLGHRIPKSCEHPHMLQYFDWCALGTQVRRLLANVSRERVHFISLDDLKKQPEETFREACEFLCVSSDFRPRTEVANRNKQLRSRTFKRITNGLARVKEKTGIETRLGTVGLLNKFNRKPGKGHVWISDGFRQELGAVFRPEVEELASSTGFDFNNWLR